MQLHKIIVILSFLFLGLFLKSLIQRETLKTKTSLILNNIIIYICLPALIFKIIPTLEVKEDSWVYPLSHWFSLLVLAVLTYIVSKACKLERKTIGCLLILVPLGNTSFLGYPMVEVFFGSKALPYAILYDQMGSFLALALYSPLILFIYGQEKSPSLVKLVKKIGGFLPLLALLASILFKDFFLKERIQKIVSLLSYGVIPLAMTALGLQLKKPSKGLGIPLIIGLSFKMILSPIITFFFFKILGGFNTPEKVVIFQSAMPPMITAGILASEKGLQKSLCLNLISVGLLFSFIVLPVCYCLLQLF
tara:strand:+ start:279 stop:1196 length:918 start_codon:yes stop_codon:yes gene_type:complete